MKRITIKKVRVKNFLSYGNAWQEIVFKKGLTIVQGYNVDTGKSNGSGKSSITEIIPFALFGKTIKELPQSKIINWNNASGCEVELYFDAGDKSYVFKRGLKPNKLKVTCDGLDIVRPADIRAFQSQLEDEIIGMDFKTFKNLIYFSPNNTVSILGTGKEQKRLFLESLFDLSEYSELLKLTNQKVGVFSEKVRETEASRVLSASLVSERNRDIEEFVFVDISEAEKRFNTSTQKLNLMVESHTGETVNELSDVEYELVKSHLATLKDLQISLDKSIVEMTTRIKHIQADVDSTNLKSIEDKVSEITTEISELEAVIEANKTDVEAFTVQLRDIEGQLSTLSSDKTNTNAVINDLKRELALKQQLIDTCLDNIDKLENADRLDGVHNCPLCKSKVSHDEIANWYIQEINDEYNRKQNHTDDMESINSKLVEALLLYDNLNADGKTLVDEYKVKQGVVSDNVDNTLSLAALRKNLGLLPDVKKLKEDLESKKDSIITITSQLNDFKWKSDLNKEDVVAKESSIKVIDDARRKAEVYKTSVDSLKNDVDNAKKNLDSIRATKKKQDGQIESKKKDIDKHNANIVLCDNDTKKFNKMLDYLGYIRVALKDENVKQFAISALLPYLNHRANHYLSESGFPYVISIDGWLEVVIRGMGVEDVSYNSLSGGETKAMDMAVQLACNDIAELQAKTTLGLSIYDEILDTSLDADGVQKLMEIIKIKQEEDGSCVLCITHREEIKELEFDHSIVIHKQNGFSTIKEN